MRDLNDILSEQELCEVAGVKPESRKKPERIARVLMKAGIFYWFKEDGTVGTTWHHIHNPKPVEAHSHAGDSFMPNFGAMRQ